jgi:SAM-dependent methyltransferase
MSECQPARMAFVASQRGLDAPDPSRCTLLDIGCGEGTGIIAIAAAFPDVRVIGFDPSTSAIAAGNALRDAAELDNVDLFEAYAADATIEPGSVDYATAHGILSWVGDAREDVIALASRSVRLGGLFMVSYNAYPGAHLREATRSVIRSHSDQLVADGVARGTDPWKAALVERIRLASKIAGVDTFFGRLMSTEADRYELAPAYLLSHDDAADLWDPFRVSDVAAMMAPHGFHYVGEMRSEDAWRESMAEEHIAQVEAIAGDDPLAQQQLIDDLTGSLFHSSLFVRADEAPGPRLDPAVVAAEAAGDVFVTATASLQAAEDDSLDGRITNAILDRRPQPIRVRDLAKEIGTDVQSVAQTVTELYRAGEVMVAGDAEPLEEAISDAPVASSLVRAQLAAGETSVITLHLTTVEVPEVLNRVLLSLLDGTRTRVGISRDLPRKAKAAGARPAEIKALIQQFDEVVDRLTAAGLLHP